MSKLPKYLKGLGVFGAGVGLIVLFKELIGGSNYAGTENLEGKTVIITGANSGIGKETAMEMARRKAKVIMACRNMKKCKLARKDIISETVNRNITCEECDLASFESIHKFARRINKKEEKIDILINNGGVMRCPKRFSEDGIELQLATNHMGHFLLTNLLLNKIQSTSSSRIISVSSVAHQRGTINFNDLNSDKKYDASEAYEQSKLANVLFIKKLGRILEGSNVICSSVHPGLVNTELGRHMSVYNSAFSYVIMRPLLWLVLKTPRQGAQCSIYTALSPDANVQGTYYSHQKEAFTNEEANDLNIQDRLWAVSKRWTKLEDGL